jgi:hypothetical protein|tara:strand:+ start:53926 stop:54603 length:678 start_codon:yes stop_codon:yes gene_type:complete
MAIKYSEKLSEKVPASLKEFTSDKPLTGYDMKKLNEQADLKLTESGNAFGINTSAWYGALKKGELKPNISLLLRMYAAFFEHIPRIHPPSLEELIEQIKAVDPDFKVAKIGVYLGYDVSSFYRVTDTTAWDKAAQPTRVLAWLISTLLKENPNNWEYIKAVFDIEAVSRGHSSLEDIVNQGGWRQPGEVPTPENPKQSVKPKTKTLAKKAPAQGVVKKVLKKRTL